MLTQKPHDLTLTLRYRLACLALMGVVFYSTYGGANHWASLQTNVPEIFAPWERHIPFWDWSIVPYWTLNGFYAAAFFLCHNKAQLHRLLQQLLLAQAIAVTCFILYPLTFTWPKPLTDGFTGRLFSTLAGFDQPFNQAPSLHIILTIIIGRFYWYRLPSWLRPWWLAWMGLIAVSVLTTYQHHFIDIPTGILVGGLIVWLLPWHHNEAVTRAWFRQPPHNPTLPKPARTTQHWRWIVIYATAAIACTLLALTVLQAAWVLWWAALALAWLAWIYVKADAASWQKKPNGQHSFIVATFSWPVKMMYRVNMAAWLRQQPLSSAVTPQLHFGSILAAPAFSAVVDVCAEQSLSPCPPHYVAIPMLDMVPPDAHALRLAADAVHQLLQASESKVLVCCALGYGRSAAVVLTYLLRYQHANDLQDALSQLRGVRSHIAISDTTAQRILEAAAHD